MHSAGQKVSKSDAIVNIIISADGPSRAGYTTVHILYNTNTTCTPHEIYTYGGRIIILMRTMMAPTRIYTHEHTAPTHTSAVYRTYHYIIFRTSLYCLRVSHMHGAPSLMVLTIWMQISERKPPKGFGAQQYYNFVPCTRQRRWRRTAGRHRIIYFVRISTIFSVFLRIIIIVLETTADKSDAGKVTAG